MMFAMVVFATANEPDLNVPLAVGVIVASTIAIVGAIIWSIRRRDRYDPSTDDPLLQSLDTVEWYGHDVAADIEDADPDQRAAILDDADKRMDKAHGRLLATAQLEDDEPAWQRLLESMTTTETTYRSFAAGDVDQVTLTESSRDLLYRLQQLRDRLG